MRVPSAKSWSSTIRLPKSTFPPRTKPADQAKYLQRCTDDLYAWQAKVRAQQKPFVLHDGPPYANGSLHAGHSVNKILKDLICRTELQQGRRVQFVPGWDCHGLPIEIKALEQVRAKSENGEVNLDHIGIRRAARNLARKTVKEQKKGFREWGIMADWENPWLTMDKEFELKQLEVFLEMTRQGLIFRRYKPVYWSPSSKSALAEAELEYNEAHESITAYIKFQVVAVPEPLKAQGVDAGHLHAVIWTTTPWTLPANKAIAVSPDLEYTVVEVGSEQLLIAKSRLEHVAAKCAFPEAFKVVVESIKGSELEGMTYVNALHGENAPIQPLIFADYVSDASGSGLVHTAPGHGMEDYDVCTKLGFEASAPVDDAGCFTDEALPHNPSALTGKSVLGGGNEAVLALLGFQVLGVHKHEHKYPYDWRTKLPVIVRATEQWFADVGSIKDKALKSLDNVKFIPENSRSRLESFIKGRSEWCISRQRAWGVPIPALYDESGKAILTQESVSHIISVIQERGIDSWWTDAQDDASWVPPSLRGEGTLKRGTDTMDVWFDSGSSWTQTEGPADVYSEGTDQHRGWFQSSLLTHISASGLDSAPFKTLVSHGFTIDQHGKKMSKSIGNVISPEEIMNGTLLPPIKRKGKATGPPAYDGLGADALRLWVASSDYTHDVALRQPVFKAINSTLLKYRTTLKMLLGSMRESSEKVQLTKLDTIALYQLQQTQIGFNEACRAYNFHKAISILNRWINTDLSSFYLEAIKDRLYCGNGGGVLYPIFMGLMHMLGPIAPSLVEESWEHRPQWMKDSTSSVHPLQRSTEELRLLTYKFPASLPTDISHLMAANAAIKTAQEEARTDKLVGSSLQSSVILTLPKESQDLFQNYADELQEIFVVSSVEFGSGEDCVAEWKFKAEFEVPGGKGTAWVLPPKEAKCPRCWKYVAPAEDELCGRCVEVVEATPSS
ncbi:isoleucyl-tRNA synthetase [Pseudogymnoascus sp. 03VT05]|nr:isoleucyl-tRNA synthetase [Pseudogymnoascus sp. 03VT05]